MSIMMKCLIAISTYNASIYYLSVANDLDPDMFSVGAVQ